jgi:flagellar capping protein FliD
MAGIQLTGLASGMDWKTTVDKLMSIEQIPQDNLKTKKTSLSKVSAAYTTLKTNLTALQTAAQGLQTGLSGYPRTATVSSVDSFTNPTAYSSASGASVATNSGAAVGTYLFNITSMGKASSLTGDAGMLAPSNDAAAALKLSDYGVTAGTFTVNGTSYTITSDDLNKTVSDFFGLDGSYSGNAVNGVAVSGLTASIVNGSLSLSNSNTSVGTAGDTSNLLSALGISYDKSKSAYSQTLPSSVLANLTLGQLQGYSLNPLSGSDALVVNGATVSASAFTSASTVGSVISAINSHSETGVSASIDAVKGTIKLTANAIGASGISVSPDSALKSLLGLGTAQTVMGNGVEGSLLKDSSNPTDAITISSDTPTIDLSKYGFGPTQFTVTNTGAYSVQVTGSGASYKSKINTFISAYNTLKQMLDDSTKITVGSDGKVQTSVLSNRADINNLISTIRSKVYASVSGTGINASLDNASKIGLGFDSSGVLSITDSTKLDAALANNPSSVEALLNLNKSAALTTPSAQMGIATRINNLMTAMTGTSGLVATAQSSITTQTSRLQSQIDAMTRSLTMTRASLERGFIAMEQAQSKYQSMTQQLTAAFK